MKPITLALRSFVTAFDDLLFFPSTPQRKALSFRQPSVRAVLAMLEPEPEITS